MNTDISMLPKAVQQEAANLLVHATKEERSKLNFKTFDPIYVHLCIYGQMTGNCEKERSTELIRLCVPNVREGRLKGYVNVDSDLTYTQNLKEEVCTPIEACIVSKRYSKYNENLINYLRQGVEG